MALAAIGGVLLVAGLLANPAGANTADDTCRQVGDELIYDLGEGPRPFNRRVNLREVFPNGNSAWVTTADDTGSVSINDINAEYSIRYRTDVDGQRQINDVPCTVDPNPIDNIPRESINCTLDSGALRWDDTPNDRSPGNFNVRSGTPGGQSSWVATQSFGFLFVGENTGDYFIRYRLTNAAGAVEVINEACAGGDVTPGEPGFCTHDKSSVVWGSVDHADEFYYLRERFEDGSSRWVETSTGTRTFVDDIAAEYFIRYWADAGNGTLTPVDNDCN